MPKVTFTREKKTVECDEGEKLRNVAIANEIELYPGMKRYFNCRGFGQCGECRVHVTKGMENLAPKTFLEKIRIGNEDKVRLSCQSKVLGDCDVETQPEFNWFGKR